jgi:CrcB protein
LPSVASSAAGRLSGAIDDWRLPIAGRRGPCHDAAVSVLLVALGGAAGSVLRYSVGLTFAHARFPYATLIVNAIGCLLIGLALPAWNRAPVLSEPLRLLLVVGFLGGFTTFSAFGHETAVLLQNSPSRAALNIVANVSIGLSAVLAGRAIAVRLLLP